MKSFMIRIVSLLQVFVMCFSVLCVPVSASGVDVGKSLWQWLLDLTEVSSQYPPSRFWQDLLKTHDYPDTAYTDYVTTVGEYYGGTSFQNDGSVFIQDWEPYSTQYYGSDNEWHSLSPVSDYLSVTSSYLRFKIPPNGSLNAQIRLDFQIAVASTVKISFPAQDSTNFIYRYVELYNGSGEVGGSLTNPGSVSSYNLSAGSYYYLISGFSNSGLSELSSWYTNAFIPPLVLVTMMPGAVSPDAPSVLPETRTGSLCGDYFYSGDNGSMTQAENIYLFDETNNIINNPATGTTATASSWKYDYETRTYTITATDGSTYTIVHGDESAEVKHTDSSNTTNIYNYYYGTSGGSGENPGEQPDKESIWDKLGKLLGSITDGFLEVVKAFLGKLLDGLTSLVDMINSKIGNIVESILALFDYLPSLFSGFTGFLAAVFPFLPQEFFDILILGAALAAVLLILKVLRK